VLGGFKQTQKLAPGYRDHEVVFHSVVFSFPLLSFLDVVGLCRHCDPGPHSTTAGVTAGTKKITLGQYPYCVFDVENRTLHTTVPPLAKGI